MIITKYYRLTLLTLIALCMFSCSKQTAEQESELSLRLSCEQSFLSSKAGEGSIAVNCLHYFVFAEGESTPLIISGPVPKGGDQMFVEYQPLVERLVAVQRKLATQYLSDAKQLIAEGRKENNQQNGKPFPTFNTFHSGSLLVLFCSDFGVVDTIFDRDFDNKFVFEVRHYLESLIHEHFHFDF